MSDHRDALVQEAKARLKATLDRRLGRRPSMAELQARAYELDPDPELSDLEKARIWQEGWGHYRNHFSPMFPEYGKNPYLKEQA